MGRARLRWGVACAALAAAAGSSVSCAETTCEETRTCSGASSGGKGSGGAGGAGGFSGTGSTGSGGTAGQPPVGSFGISVATKSVTLIEASQVELTVAVARNDMADPVTVDLVGLPTGVTATPVVATASDASVKLTLQAAAGVDHAVTAISVRGKAGADEKTVPVDLSVRGAPGALDNGFGTGGETVGIVSGEWSRPRAVALGPDQKVYVVGETGSTTANTHAYFAVRLTSDGNLDTTFGSAGMVVRYEVAGTGAHAARGVFVDTQGRSVVGGSFGTTQFFVARFDASGGLDATFGTAGEVVSPGFVANAIAQQATKTVVVGQTNDGPGYAAVARLDADGKADTAFGLAGLAKINTVGYSSTALATAIDASNRIVIAGSSNKPGSPLLAARMTPSGGLDAYGTAGIAWLAPGSGSTMSGLAVRPDKRALIGGGFTGDGYFLLQLDEQGALDATFGTSGVVTGNVMRIDAMTLDASGRLVAAGRLAQLLRLGRFGTDGKPDTTFGNGGFADPGKNVTPQALVAQPDGRVVLVGIGSDKLYVSRVWM
ncbi:MAG: hypothetical protein IT377_17540 [Polyangiaceae bacterium]|nr:hypothetical protein [Polyangiaceae bacterium]